MNEPNPYAPTSNVSDSPFDQGQGAPLATRGQRFAGAFIDGFVQLLIAFPLGFAIGLGVAVTMGDGPATQVVANLLGGLMGIGVFLALNGYLLATRGKTIGKLAVNTRIVDRDTGELVPFWPLILKRYSWIWIVAMIPLLNLILLIDSLMIFRSSVACLHDDIANTKVIVD